MLFSVMFVTSLLFCCVFDCAVFVCSCSYIVCWVSCAFSYVILLYRRSLYEVVAFVVSRARVYCVFVSIRVV